MGMDLVIHPAYIAAIRWSKRGSCGNAGCKDPECACAFCGLPIGVPEDDPRWDEHSEYCDDCELYCFDKIAHFRTGIAKA
jgi:hypothetical protein